MISPSFVGFRAIGFGIFLSIVSTLVIHGGFSYVRQLASTYQNSLNVKTRSWVTFGTLLPDPFFRLKVKNMHRVCFFNFGFGPVARADLVFQGKHGSDSEAYNQLGEFDSRRFDYIFDIYSSEPHSHLTFLEGIRMLHGNRNPFDPVKLSLCVA